jgi:hypothetical protein
VRYLKITPKASMVHCFCQGFESSGGELTTTTYPTGAQGTAWTGFSAGLATHAAITGVGARVSGACRVIFQHGNGFIGEAVKCQKVFTFRDNYPSWSRFFVPVFSSSYLSGA